MYTYNHLTKNIFECKNYLDFSDSVQLKSRLLSISKHMSKLRTWHRFHCYDFLFLQIHGVCVVPRYTQDSQVTLGNMCNDDENIYHRR